MKVQMKNSKIPNKCIACGETLNEPFFTMEDMPMGAFYMLGENGLKEDHGIALSLSRCPNCGLFQLDVAPVKYYREAIRIVGLSETMRDLRNSDYTHLLETYDLKGKKWIEIGCGSGDFLKILKDYPVEIYGTEAAPENVEKAREALGLDFKRILKFFPEYPNLMILGGPFDCFLSFNFLEHQPDPWSMLKCIWNNLTPKGIGLITVPSFEYTLEHGAYYELIRDHIANYDMGSLENLLYRCGFRVLEKRFIALGDTIEMVVQKASVVSPPDNNKVYAKDDVLFKKCLGLKENYYKTRERIQNFCGYIRGKGWRLALWGASHQGMTLAATTALKDTASYIIDSSDKKQGHFAPVSHLMIVPPERYALDPVDVIMISAPEFTAEIEKGIRARFGAPGSPGAPKVCDMINLTLR